MKIISIDNEKQKYVIQLTYDEIVGIQNTLYRAQKEKGAKELEKKLFNSFKALEQICRGNLPILKV